MSDHLTKDSPPSEWKGILKEQDEAMSDHPRTDEAVEEGIHEDRNHPATDWVTASFARTLEAENAGLVAELGRNSDAPSPTGSVYALKNYWKLRCDELSEENAGLRNILDAARNFIKVEGRHHAEIATKRLIDAVKEYEALRGKGGAGE
jgi:hypothetical protein